MIKRVVKFYFIMVFIGIAQFANSQQLAFPGAEGFGRYATGGRGGTVYHVTNLDDSGPGSFRDAVSQPNRIVVFDIGGVINITERIVVSKNITIAGQTAPGDGITIYGNGVSFSGADNTICRYIRFRMGKNGTSGKDAVALANGTTMIFDHISVSWGLDENFSVNWDNKGTEPAHITIQNSIIGQGLQTHSCGGLLQTSGGVSVIGCLYIDNKTRNAKVKGVNEFINNVIYNWGTDGYILGDSEGESFVNIIGTYFIEGPSTSYGSEFTRGNTNFHLYAYNNYVDNNKNGKLDGRLITQSEYTTVDWVTTPFSYPKLDASTPEEAYTKVVKEVGASYPARDEVDKRLITELTSLGTLGQLISSEYDSPMNGPGIVNNGSSKVDTDRDGMPDTWELSHGMNPYSSLDQNLDYDGDGYTNIEEYINFTDPGYGKGSLPSGSYQILNSNSKKAIQVEATSNADGTKIIEAEANKSKIQIWDITLLDDGYYKIVNQSSSFALTVENASSLDNANIVQSSYTSAENQKWQIIFNNGYYSFINKKSNKSIDISGTGNLIQSISSDAASQKFYFIPYNNLFSPPSGAIITPAANEILTNGSNIKITVNALDYDGKVTKVEFYNNNDKIGEDSISPYVYNITNSKPGNYLFSAKITDNDNLTATTANVSVTVINEGSSPCTIQEKNIGFCSVEGTVDSNNAGFTGAGFANTDNAVGKGITWFANIAAEGVYTITWRYANSSGNRTAKLIVNKQTLLSSIDFNATGSWTTWTAVSVQVNLPAGIDTIRLEALTSSGLANIDFIEISGDKNKPASCVPIEEKISLNIDWYYDFADSTITNLYKFVKFPNNPDARTTIDSLMIANIDEDNYGLRIRGYIVPKLSGEYNFFISGNGASVLWFSTDSMPDKAEIIANTPGGNTLNEWSKYTEQQSASIYLTANEKYYFEIHNINGTGEKHVEISWKGQGIGQQVIGNKYILPVTDSSIQGVDLSKVITAIKLLKDDYYIYPNPCNDILFVKINGFSNNAYISIYNLMGKCVINLKAQNYNRIDLSNLNSGVYILRIINNNKSNTYKIIKK